jgi:hypothetical protein
MKTKDQILLENLYSKSVLKENDYYVNLNGDVIPDEYNKSEDKDVSDLIERISGVLNDHDTSEDIAKAIAQVVKNEYQTDVIRPFKEKLNEYLPDPSEN